jgi:hypothetical protein
MPARSLPSIVVFLLTWVVVSTAPSAQIPTTFQNLQHYPKDISRDELILQMRQFSFALGVRCQYCHAGGDGISFDGVKFESDEKIPKVKARQMLQMVNEINTKVLAGISPRVDPPVRIACVTCHRGSPVPRTLEDELMRVITANGAEAAAARYRELRQNAHLGRYNFGEITVTELARRLYQEKNADAAITMLKLNAEFYPKSADIDVMLGELLLEKGDRDAAIASFRAALEKQPANARAKQRLEELTKK